jgi:cytochrome c oxidase assembly protein subunit 11
MSNPGRPLLPENRHMLVRLLVVTAGMFGFGFALVPFYEKICQETGLRNLLQPDHVKTVNTQVDASRSVTVEFDTNARGMHWAFRPLVSHMAVHPGELQQAEFEIRNDEDHPLTGQAIPSYSPALAAEYFRKIECFCFSQQVLKPGESRKMPVVFFVDPGLPRNVGTITLSFTFFQVNGTSSGASNGTAGIASISALTGASRGPAARKAAVTRGEHRRGAA